MLNKLHTTSSRKLEALLKIFERPIHDHRYSTLSGNKKAINTNLKRALGWLRWVWSHTDKRYILPGFSVTPTKIDRIKSQNRYIQQIKSRILEMKGGKYAKILAKIQVRAIFHMRDIRRNVLPKFIELCMETSCWCPYGLAPTWRPESNRNICHWVLLRKRVFNSRGTHKHYSNTFGMNCSDSTIARNKSHDSSLQGHSIDLFGKFLLAGRCGGNNMSFEGKCRWEKRQIRVSEGDLTSRIAAIRVIVSCCYDVNLFSPSQPPFPTKGVNFALGRHPFF